MRIFFTGGSGKAGRHVAAYLAEQGHRVTNADLTPLGHPDVADLRVDLTDAGETYSALAGLATAAELDLPEQPSYDAVVHFAAVPRILLAPDATTYATNVLSTYHVLEAATRLGVRKIVLASSETTYGICFARGERRPAYLPVDEDHPTVPEDSYAMSKVAGEVTARAFQARTGADVYSLRINNVIEPHEYAELFPAFLADPALRRRNVFAYIDTRDLAQLVRRCLEVDGLGYEVFNVANADLSVAATNEEVRARFYDGVEVRRAMAPDETFYSIERARRLLGYEPEHSWRDAGVRPPRRRRDVSDLELVGGVEKRELFLVEHDPAWAEAYAVHEARVRRALGDLVVAVEHIGSTSVPGLAAKPIIDVLVTVPDITAEEDYLDPLLAAGYVLRVREPGHRLMRTEQRDVHIHVLEPQDVAAHDYLLLRDRLRVDEEDRALYEATKRELVSREWSDMNAYADAKTDVIEAIKARARSVRSSVTPGDRGPGPRGR